MANKTVYPYGTGGSLPSSVGIINDLTTGGADKALSAEQGKVLNERFLVTFFSNSDSADWQSGNIRDEKIVTTYANKYLELSLAGLPSTVTSLRVSRNTPPDSTYYLNVYTSADGTNFSYVKTFGTVAGVADVDVTGKTHVLFLLYDKPSTERAQAESITITYESLPVLKSGVAHSVFDSDKEVMDATVVKKMAGDLDWTKTLTTASGGFSWEQGGINGSTGAEESNSKAIRTGWIKIRSVDFAKIARNAISGYNFFVTFYDSSGTRLGAKWGFGDISAEIQSLLSTPTGYMRFCYYGSNNILPSNEYANALVVELTQKPAGGGDGTNVEYENPVLRVDNPDPTVWDGEDGYWYLYATGQFSAKKMFRSANLYEWEQTGDAPMNDTEAMKVVTAFGGSALTQVFWAPHVFKVNPTTWNLYLVKPDTGGLAILTSHHPTRGYTFVKFISSGGGGQFIDPELGYDTDGKLWMFTGGYASIYRRQMTADGLDWAEGSSYELCAGLNRNASDNVNREKTFEGPYLYRRGGYWYLFCSSGQYSTGNYKLRVVRSATLGGTFVDSEGNLATEGYAETVLQSGPYLTGPGHNAPIFVDKNNDNWILYHSHWSGAGSSSARFVCLDKIEWDENGWPSINDGTPSASHVIPKM